MSLMASITDQDTLLQFAGERLGMEGPWGWGKDAQAIGVIERETGLVVAVMVMNGFFGSSCFAHFATDRGKSWASRDILRSLFSFMFDYRGVERCIGVVQSGNTGMLILMQKLGFEIEGRIRGNQGGTKADLVGVMFPDTCPWIKEEAEATDGQTEST